MTRSLPVGTRKPQERSWPAESTEERLDRCHAMLRLHPACPANGCRRVFGVEDGVPPCGEHCFKIRGPASLASEKRKRGKR